MYMFLYNIRLTRKACKFIISFIGFLTYIKTFYQIFTIFKKNQLFFYVLQKTTFKEAFIL